MKRLLLYGLTLWLAVLLTGCGRVPPYRVLAGKANDGWVEIEIFTQADNARMVQRVIDDAIAGARRQYHPYHVTVYVLDTEIYIGVVYDVAVAYWDRGGLGGKKSVYLREKIVHPGSVPKPTDEELAYYGVMHRLWLNRPDLLSADERARFLRFRDSHSQQQLDQVILRVQRWLFA